MPSLIDEIKSNIVIGTSRAALPQIGGQRAVIIGSSFSSIAESKSSTSNNSTSQSLWHLVNAWLGWPWDIVKVSGVTGDRTDQWIARLAAEVANYEPGWILCFAGYVNDIAQGVDASTVIDNLRKLFDSYPNRKFVMTSSLPSSATGYYDTFAKRSAFAIVTNWLMQQAPLDCKNVIPVDIFSVLMDTSTGNNISGVMDDNLHPNPVGINKLVPVVYNKLKNQAFAPRDAFGTWRDFSNLLNNTTIPGGGLGVGTSSAYYGDGSSGINSGTITSGWQATNEYGGLSSNASWSVVARNDGLAGSWSRTTIASGKGNLGVQRTLVSLGSGVGHWTASAAKTSTNRTLPVVDNGFVYEATNSGTTGTSEPVWPITPGATVTDGSVTWVTRPMPYPGDKLRFRAEIRFPNAGTQTGYLQVALKADGSGTPFTAMWNYYNSNPVQNLPTQPIIVETPDFTVPDGVGQLRAVIVGYANGGTALDFDVGRANVYVNSRPSTISQTGAGGVIVPSNNIFSSDSFWYTAVPVDAPVHSNNTNLVQSVVNQKTTAGVININTNSYTSPVYIADANTPLVNVGQWSGNTSFPYSKNIDGSAWTADTTLTGHFTGVPIPTWAIPSDGTDMEMTVYQPSTGKIWEFWLMRKNTSGQWEARWGGRMDNVNTSNGIWTNPYGVAASGLPYIGGQITAEELQAGHIDHVIGMSLPLLAASTSISWPATRSDGHGDGIIKEGQRFRLDPAYDVDASSLHPIAKIIAKAAQKYGFVIWNYTGTPALRARNAYSYTQKGMANPYTTLFNGTADSAILAGFPWDQLKFLPDNYGQVLTAPNLMSTLTDSFDDNSLDPKKWALGSYENLPQTGVNVVEQNARIEITPASGTAGNNYSGIKSVNAFDLTGSQAYVRFLQNTAPLLGVETQFVTYVDANNSLSWVTSENAIFAGTRVGGTKATVYSATYDPAIHAWLRIREAGGTIYFDTAPSNASNPPASGEWVNRGSTTVSFGVTGMKVNMQAGSWQSVANPGKAIFDGFNTASGVVSDVLNATFVDVKNDMTLPHQASVHGINPYWNWGTGPRVGIGVAFPGTFNDPQLVVWGIIGTDNAGNPATNVRVQIRKMISDVKRGGVWTRFVFYTNYNLINGALYTSYETNTSVPADIVNHGVDGISVKMPSGGGSFHFFTKDRFPIATGAQEIVNRFEARLIVDNVSGTDDRASAKILACSGGDIWKNATAQWSSTDYNNDDVAIGRFRYITNDWQMFTSHTLTTDAEVTDYIGKENTLTPR